VQFSMQIFITLQNVSTHIADVQPDMYYFKILFLIFSTKLWKSQHFQHKVPISN